MSTVIILTPIIIGGWPTITAAVAGAAAALGLAVKESVKEQVKQAAQEGVANEEQQVEIALADSEVLAQSMAIDKEIVLTKGNVELRVRRDERGRCTVCAKGKGHSKAELKQMAEQFTQKMTQCFVYNRVATELKNKGFQTVNEEVMDDEAIRINVRRWVD
ncbi:MAG: hypothetical protein A2Z25_12815 [Planctomycetes bacterium RBG_16_55_9]|nr:MAG: hypothetical protein A2Z25_12815 [Planctomycetes bacterium RBG_16_55_9]